MNEIAGYVIKSLLLIFYLSLEETFNVAIVSRRGFMTSVGPCLLRTQNNGAVSCKVLNGRVLNQFNRSLARKTKLLFWCQGVDYK